MTDINTSTTPYKTKEYPLGSIRRNSTMYEKIWNNSWIRIAICKSCSNKIQLRKRDAITLIDCSRSFLMVGKTFSKSIELSVLDKIVECCSSPEYLWYHVRYLSDTEKRKIVLNML